VIILAATRGQEVAVTEITTTTANTMAGDRFVLQVYVGAFSRLYEALSIEASKQTTAEENLECDVEKLC
jgi:hypothetical protein